jgi:hypothetical protein
MLEFFKKFLPQPKHPSNWILLSSTYAPPAPMSFVTQNMDKISTHPELVEKLVNGSTTLILQDDTTGELKQITSIGTDENKLESIAAKADREGMQYFTVGDHTYALTRWIPEETNDA